jgi:hypothetical protein
LRDHPQVRQQIDQNPTAFMRDEDRLNARDEDRMRDNGMRRDDNHDRIAHFGEFLGGHPDLSDQLSRNPELVRNQEFMENHPDFKEYLRDHPDVQNDLMANPQNFIKSAQQFNTSKGSYGGHGAKSPSPTPAPQPQTKPPNQ